MSKSANSETGQSSSSVQKPEITHQMTFGDDGNLEPSDEPTETDLGDWGADIDESGGTQSRIDSGASEKFVDDRTVRPRLESDDEGEQESLLVGPMDENQQSLSGDTGPGSCKFESEDTD